MFFYRKNKWNIKKKIFQQNIILKKFINNFINKKKGFIPIETKKVIFFNKNIFRM